MHLNSHVTPKWSETVRPKHLVFQINKVFSFEFTWKIFYILNKWSPDFSLSNINRIYEMLSYLWAVKYFCFNFYPYSIGGFFFINAKHVTFSWKAVTNCLIRPSLVWSRGKNIFSRPNKWTLMIFFSKFLFSLFSNQVVCFVSTIGEAREARIFGVLTLLTKRKVYHFLIHADHTLTFSILYLLKDQSYDVIFFFWFRWVKQYVFQFCRRTHST